MGADVILFWLFAAMAVSGGLMAALLPKIVHAVFSLLLCFLGVTGIYRLQPGGEPELVYSLAPACWGRGLASEASRAVIADAFGRLGFARVLARTDAPNRASIAVMKRLGMQYLGEREEAGRPTVSYVLVRPKQGGEVP